MDDRMIDQDVSAWREVPHGLLHLERVEAAGMGTLTRALADADMRLAWSVAKLLRYLSIV